MNIEDVLELIKKKVEEMDSVLPEYLRSNGSDNGFEKLIPIIAHEVALEISPTNKLEILPHLGHHFPDIDLTLDGVKYGVELKSRNNGTWSTNGNSVLESITSDNYEEIYLLFGSKIRNQNRILVRYAPYWQTTSAIKVTHSPRFTIDINNLQDSVFKDKDEYDSLRNLSEADKIHFLQDYLKNHNEGAKWYVAPENNILPTPFNDLSKTKQNLIRSEIFILYPNDLINLTNQIKYTRAAQYLINNYFIYNKSLRDVFTASGKVIYNNIEFPKLFSNMKEQAIILQNTLETASLDFIDLVYQTWNTDNLLISSSGSDTFINDYKTVLDIVGNRNNTLSILLHNAGYSSLSDFIFTN